MPRRPIALVVVWLAGVVVAVSTGVLAVRQVADRVGGTTPPPLSAAGVESELSRASASSSPAGAGVAPPAAEQGPTGAPAPLAPAPPGPQATPAPAAEPAPAPVSRSFTSPGGSIGVSCQGAASPQLVYATPAQGWAVDEARAEEGRVEVRFRSDDEEVRIRAGCGADGPDATVETRGGSGGGSDDD